MTTTSGAPARLKLLLGVGPSEAYPAGVSRAAQIRFAVFLFVWMTAFFAVSDAWGNEQTFFAALPSAALAGFVAAVIATVLVPWFAGRFSRR